MGGETLPFLKEVEITVSVKSRSNVFKILSESNFIFEEGRIKYFFASATHLEKFIELKEVNRERINESLTRRFKIKLCLNEMCDIVLYSKVETRGFYLEIEGVGYSWISNLELNGIKTIEKI